MSLQYGIAKAIAAVSSPCPLEGWSFPQIRACLSGGFVACRSVVRDVGRVQVVELLIALWLTVMVDKSFPVTVYFLSCCLGSQRVNKPLQSPLGGLLKHTLSGDQ